MNPDIRPDLFAPPPASWLALTGRLRIPDDRWRPVWHTLLRNYGEAHRHYHTLEHVTACIQQLDRIRSLAGEPDLLELALWFHDIIYDSRRHDNEQQSAAYALEVLQGWGVSDDLCSTVAGLILLTRHPARPHSQDEALLLDIDLGILGSTIPAYAHYEQQIRQEYAHIPWPQYCQGRSQLLASFLAQPHIYHTAHFRARLEQPARYNLQQAILRLGASPEIEPDSI